MSTPNFFEQLGHIFIDLWLYVLLGILGILGMLGKNFFIRANKTMNEAVTREELQQHMDNMNQQVMNCHTGLKAEQDYIRQRVDDIYTIMIQDAKEHRRTKSDGRDE